MADHVRYISSIPPYIYVILREEPYGPHSLNNSSSNKTVLHLLKMISSAAPVAKAAVCHSTFVHGNQLLFLDDTNSEIHGFIPAGRRYHEGSVHQCVELRFYCVLR
ncbi:unnamed protein product [Brassica oleracea]